MDHVKDKLTAKELVLGFLARAQDNSADSMSKRCLIDEATSLIRLHWSETNAN